MLTKTINFDDDVLEVLQKMDIQQENGHFVGILRCGQLERKLYERTNKALEAMGGKWNRKVGGHIFATDPSLHLSGLLDNGTLHFVKDGWFPTPRAVVEMMIKRVDPAGKILEPSAGEGAIADVLIENGASIEDIQCVEINEQRAETLRRKGYYVTRGDFMQFSPVIQKFDRVYMNPPFENGQDIDHVRHAFDLLKPGGRLASVMSEGPFFRSDNKATEFRDWLDGVGYSMQLPKDAFKSSGTTISTRLVFADKPAPLAPTQARLWESES